MLAHIDFLDAAIADPDTSLATATAPLRALLKRVCTIPGIRERTTIMLLTECGADMSVFRTPATWPAGQLSVRATTPPAAKPIRPDPTRFHRTAHCLDRSRPRRRTHQNTYLAAHHAHIRSRRGLRKVIGATATTCSSPTGTLSTTKSTMPNSARTGHNAIAHEYRTRRLVHEPGHTVTL
jgi:transposase